MKSQTCGHCGELDNLTVLDVPTFDEPDKPQTLQAVVCITCGAQGPKCDGREAALDAWQQRFLDLEFEDHRFAVAWGYDKFLLTLEQAREWQDVDKSESAYSRLQDRRHLLQKWQLLPPSSYVESQRSF